MKKVAILIDGEWFRIALINELRGALKKGVTAEVLYKNALLAVDNVEEELLRIFFYDCEPHEGKARNPISKQYVPFTSKAKDDARRRFFYELGHFQLFALRLGV